jgi:hypothetical protein
MAESQLGRASSESYPGPPREETEGLVEWAHDTEFAPCARPPGFNVRPGPPATSAPVPGNETSDYPGPSRIELRSLTDWAIETEAALNQEMPIVHPAGGEVDSANASRRRPSTDFGEVKVTVCESGAKEMSERPAIDSLWQELDDIRASLVKRAPSPVDGER